MKTYMLPEENHGKDAYELIEQGCSFTALGIYAYLNSHIPGEEITLDELVEASPDEREQLYKAVEKLANEGIIEEVAGE